MRPTSESRIFFKKKKFFPLRVANRRMTIRTDCTQIPTPTCTFPAFWLSDAHLTHCTHFSTFTVQGRYLRTTCRHTERASSSTLFGVNSFPKSPTTFARMIRRLSEFPRRLFQRFMRLIPIWAVPPQLWELLASLRQLRLQTDDHRSALPARSDIYLVGFSPPLYFKKNRCSTRLLSHLLLSNHECLLATSSSLRPPHKNKCGSGL